MGFFILVLSLLPQRKENYDCL